jgi:hypothetical protein
MIRIRTHFWIALTVVVYVCILPVLLCPQEATLKQHHQFQQHTVNDSALEEAIPLSNRELQPLFPCILVTLAGLSIYANERLTAVYLPWLSALMLLVYHVDLPPNCPTFNTWVWLPSTMVLVVLAMLMFRRRSGANKYPIVSRRDAFRYACLFEGGLALLYVSLSWSMFLAFDRILTLDEGNFLLLTGSALLMECSYEAAQTPMLGILAFVHYFYFMDLTHAITKIILVGNVLLFFYRVRKSKKKHA